MHEQCVQETLGSLAQRVTDGSIVGKGEFVIVIAGAAPIDESTVDADRLLRLLGEQLSAREAARIAAEVTGAKKNALYERLLELKQAADS
jgi:16S rRNA (cytidine1402-2'-O)-methyltransferase